jgi:hypothetical protein
MLKNVTLSAEDVLIKKVREKAKKEQRTLNELFREWMRRYINKSDPIKGYNEFMEHIDYANAGRKFSREEMNER